MSLICSWAGASPNRNVSGSSRSVIAPTITCVVRVPCLSSSRAPGRSGFSASQQSVVSSSLVTRGGASAAASRSPREMSMSSASRIVTLRPAPATSSGPSAVSTAATVVRRPPGSTTTSSPGATVPDATWPA